MTGRKSADRKQEGAVRRQMWVAGPMLSIGVILVCRLFMDVSAWESHRAQYGANAPTTRRA